MVKNMSIQKQDDVVDSKKGPIGSGRYIFEKFDLSKCFEDTPEELFPIFRGKIE